MESSETKYLKMENICEQCDGCQSKVRNEAGNTNLKVMHSLTPGEMGSRRENFRSLGSVKARSASNCPGTIRRKLKNSLGSASRKVGTSRNQAPCSLLSVKIGLTHHSLGILSAIFRRLRSRIIVKMTRKRAWRFMAISVTIASNLHALSLSSPTSWLFHDRSSSVKNIACFMYGKYSTH